MISLKDVHLKLQSGDGEVRILRGVDLKVERGETLAVVGPSGAGKSTLIMVIAGLERPSAGTVQINGHQIDRMDEDALALFRRDNIGIVFQAFHLVPAMTALENVTVPLELAGAADAYDRAEAALEAVGLAHRTGHYPAQLSGGEQQRVALARAFAPRPEIILADEPTGNLDSVTGKEVMDLLFALAARHGTTVMLITHDQAVAHRCSRTLHLADGRILGDGQAPADQTP